MARGIEISDAQRWLSLMLRHVCAPNWSVKTLALSSLSTRTIMHRMLAEEAMISSQDERIARLMQHQTIMMKAGARLGLVR